MAQQKRNELRQLLLKEGKIRPETAPRAASREESRLQAIEARRKDMLPRK